MQENNREHAEQFDDIKNCVYCGDFFTVLHEDNAESDLSPCCASDLYAD